MPKDESDPARSARRVGLRYVSDSRPGIARKRSGKGFTYLTTTGKPLRDRRQLARIESLVIPPAWKNVWICKSANGHIQATGLDARGRKQYLYHPRWRELRDEQKFDNLVAFAESLPKLRRRVERDLKRRGLPREKVLAAVVKLLDKTQIRIGNDEYARENNSFGLSTLRDKHVKVQGKRICFRFLGKNGKAREVGLEDRRLAKVVSQCQDLPGQELFQYVDDNDEVVDVTSSDVNEYLGEDRTAKDFRTWAGTVIALKSLRNLPEGESDSAAKRNIVRAVEEVAKCLGNTKAVCRKSYIHPAVIDAYLEGGLKNGAKSKRAPHGLRADEAAALAFLKS